MFRITPLPMGLLPMALAGLVGCADTAVEPEPRPDPAFAKNATTESSTTGESGVIVGISSVVPVVNGPIHYHGFVWERGTMTDLGTLGGTTSYALGVNNRGEVVGYAFDASGAIHAVLWRP